jgi:hypothetical protein
MGITSVDPVVLLSVYVPLALAVLFVVATVTQGPRPPRGGGRA